MYYIVVIYPIIQYYRTLYSLLELYRVVDKLIFSESKIKIFIIS